jgi:uncharacterized phage protein (TIGR01671 family)
MKPSPYYPVSRYTLIQTNRKCTIRQVRCWVSFCTETIKRVLPSCSSPAFATSKEIYEGDIVRASYDGSLECAGTDAEVREVVWGANETGDSHYPASDLKGIDMETNALSYAKNSGELEVIGNIYENGELIGSATGA